MVGILPIEAKIKWKEQLPTFVHAYKCSFSNVKGFSPFYLMFGRQPMLPINVKSGVKNIRHSCFHITWLYPKLQKRLD